MKNWLRSLFPSGTPKKESPELSTAADPGSEQRLEARRILTRASLGQRGVMVHSSQLGASWQGSFCGIEETEVLLSLELNEVRALFTPGDFCTVTFDYDEHAHVFLTTVKRSQLSEQGQLDVALYMPDAVHTAGRRNLYRVPILQDLSMEVRIDAATGFSCSARALDINVSGVRLKLETESFSRFSMGEEVQLTITLDNIRVHRVADVRHLDALSNALGLHFLTTKDTDERQNTGALVREAERSYLRRVSRIE